MGEFKILDMTGELIGNEIQPEGGIEEVLLPPIRAGLKRSLRERKTRLKDINYHLGRFALWLVLPPKIKNPPVAL